METLGNPTVLDIVLLFTCLPSLSFQARSGLYHSYYNIFCLTNKNTTCYVHGLPCEVIIVIITNCDPPVTFKVSWDFYYPRWCESIVKYSLRPQTVASGASPSLSTLLILAGIVCAQNCYIANTKIKFLCGSSLNNDHIYTGEKYLSFTLSAAITTLECANELRY